MVKEEVETKMKKSSKIKKEKKLSKVEELEKQLAEAKTDHLRVLADFENFRTRNQKELFESRDRAVADFVIDLLPAIDNFEMSLKMTDNKEMFIKGVEMIHKNLIDTLKEHNFEDFEPKVGENFDPYLHEPLLIESDKHKPGQIVSVLKKGFKHKDKVVRPARVQVVKDKE